MPLSVVIFMYGHTVGDVGGLCGLGSLYMMSVPHSVPAMDIQFGMQPYMGVDCLVGYLLILGFEMRGNLFR